MNLGDKLARVFGLKAVFDHLKDSQSKWLAIFARNMGEMEGEFYKQDVKIANAIQENTAAIEQNRREMQTLVDGFEATWQRDVNETCNMVVEAVNEYGNTVWEQSEAIDRQREEVHQAVAQWEGMVSTLRNAVEEADLKILNTPNLLKKDAWWVDGLNGQKLICGNAARWSKSGGAYMDSITDHIIYYTEPTAEQTAGATYVYHREAENGYSEAWYVYHDNEDGITTEYAELTGSAIIRDQDEEEYHNAIQYNIQANSAWGNMETLFYPQGMSTQYYKQGETPKSYGYFIDEMTPGMTYTVSCWARLISGEEAWVRFGWGGTHLNQVNNGRNCGVSDVIPVKSTEWKRISWTFVFDPQDVWYTETSETITPQDGPAYTRIARHLNWEKRVIIGVCRKYNATLQLAGFRLTAGGLYGNNTIDTLRLQLAEDENRLEALEAQGANVLASIAPVENGSTASTNYPAGALIIRNGTLYKTTTAVTTGASWAVGTNIRATTLAAELDSIRNA